MSDATFEDGAQTPLRLQALDTQDLEVLSGLCQDAVFPASEIRWDRKRRRFAILLNRFRWEDALAAERRGREFERVQSVLVVENVEKVRSQGVVPGDGDMVLSLLSLTFEPGAEGSGRLLLTLAGDGALACDVEALEVLLKDVTRPYGAVSGKRPDHG